MGVIFKNSVMYNSSNILNYPVCYSEEEREIGCWTDGKPLYQTTIHTGTLTKDGNWHSIAHNIPNIDKIILCTGTVYAADNTAYFMPNYRPGLTQGICLDATTTNIEYIQNWLDSSPDSYVTLQYTKTTDQPGSGSWTPQEIPAHHYSTNEQVVGTWINGRVLYEQTLHYTESSEQTGKTYDISSIGADYVFLTNAEVKFGSAGGNDWYSAPYYYNTSNFATVSVSNSGLVVRVLGWGYTEVYATIRYTKST